MDKFMIDKYIAEKPFEKPVVEKPIVNPLTNNVAINPNNPFEKNLLANNLAINPKSQFSLEQEDSIKVFSLRFISTTLMLSLFVGFAIYHAVAYKYNENHYLIKKNARKFEITLDELKTDIKNAIKQKYEQMIDWKEEMRTRSKKMVFNKHLENGAFKTTKYKATNLLSMFDKT